MLEPTLRRGRRHVSSDVRASAVLRLQSLRDGGEFRSDHVRIVADQLGVEVRTVWKWLRAARLEGRAKRKTRRRLEAGERDVIDLAYHRGNVAAFHRARREAGPTPSIHAWRAAFHRALSPGRMAGLTDGERARRDYDTYLTRQPKYRNECWEADHTELAVRVLLPDGRLVKPWLTLFTDVFSRAIVGWAIVVTPSRESILAAMRAAILVDERTGIGGVPAAFRFDRGKDFLANAVRVAAGSLAIEVRALPGYEPHRKGGVERLNESIEQLFLAELPGYVHGSRDRAGRQADADDPPLPLEQLVALFADFVIEYNEVRPHEGIAGRTPLAQWSGDATPLHTIESDRLRHLLLEVTTRVVSKRGVRLGGKRYNCAELCGYVGQTVQVRFMPHHDNDVEVFLDGRHLGTALLIDEMSAAEAKRLIQHRYEDARWLRKTQRAAAKIRRVRYAALTEPGPVVTASADASERVAAELVGYRDADQRRLASRSLADPGPVPDRMARLTRNAS